VTERGTIIDWPLAERTAGAVIGLGRGAQSSYTRREVADAAVEGIAAAAAYAGLGTPADPPTGELVGRGEWSRNALATIRGAAAPLERRLADQVNAPGPLGPVLRRASGAALGVEVGLAAGYAAGRVLGQLDFSLFGEPRPPRLLFVGENLERARSALEADRAAFLRWVAIHEGTHVVQFECVPWLAGYLRELAGDLVEGAAADLDAGSLSRFGRELLRSPREVVRALLRGELARLVADPARREQIDRLQATMSVIEGHAEHVMDAAAGDLGGELATLRDRLDRRRAQRGGIGELIGRLLGMEAKLRQYELGKAFCDAIVARGGPTALISLWETPERLPSLAEIEQPDQWFERTKVALTSGV
jgi:coenzyme F420 biosynthesis associated uncharacterized protein